MSNQLEVTTELIIHATENDKKVFEPISELFAIKEEDFQIEKILGHYGNPILLAKVTLVKKNAREFIKKFVTKIPKKQMEQLIENIDEYFEDSSLFFRISKSDLVNKEVNLQQENAIKIKVKMPIYKKDQISKKYIELLTNP